MEPLLFDSLKSALAAYPFPADAKSRLLAAKLKDNHDYLLRESLASKLIAQPRRGGEEIIARMPVLDPGNVYVISARGREPRVSYLKGSGGNIAAFSRYEYGIWEGSEELGRVEYYPISAGCSPIRKKW